MGHSPAPLHTGHFSWQGFLLTASLLTFWNVPPTAQLTLEAVPPIAAEGQSVLLRALNLGENLQAYEWYKGAEVRDDHLIARYVLTTNATVQGPAHSGRETVYHNGSLLVLNLIQNDSGNFTLKTTNQTFDVQKASVEFIVYQLLSQPVIRINNSNPVEGEDSVALTCEPQTQHTTYHWKVNDQNLPDDDRLELSEGNRTLVILSVTRNDTGPYKCEVRNAVSANQSDSVLLNVTYGPDAPTVSPPDSYFQAGTNLSLSCRTVSNPPAQYSWLVNGKPHSSSPDLFIPNITTNDSGSYSCLVHNPITGLNRTTVKNITVLELLSQPVIRINNSNPVEGEDSVALTCEPQTQHTTYHWKVNDQNLPDDDRLELSEGNRTLVILSVTRNDTGPYKCEVRNAVSANQSDSVLLNVTYGPDAPTVSPPDSYFQAGTNLSLSCRTVSNPPAQYSWLVNGKPHSSSPDLFIPNITTNDSGSYSCLVHNPITGLNRTTVKNITVLEPVTQPSINTTNTTVKEGDAASLTCFSDHSETSIRWIFKNQPLQLSDNMQLSNSNRTLSINPVRRENDGEYQCEASNPVSASRSDVLKLTVNATTDDPTNTSSGLSTGAIVGIVVGVVVGVILIAALAHFLYSRKTGRASDQRDLTEHKLSASNQSRGPSDTESNKVNDVAYSSLNFNAQQQRQPTSASPTPTASETVYSEVKKK